MADFRTGVYCWKNTVNGKIYVGSTSKSFKTRKEAHLNDLRANRHVNRHLQHAWNKYGEGAFVFEILERCSPGDCIEREQHWIDTLKAVNPDFGYNINPNAGSCLGHEHTEETKQKISRSKKGTKLSEEQKQGISKFMKGNTYASGNKGVKKSDQCRQRMVEAWKRRRAEGVEDSEETKQKRSAASKEVWERPGMRERLSNAHKGKKHTPEQTAKIKAKTKGKKRSPETIERMKAAQQLRRQKAKAPPTGQMEFDFGSTE